MKSGSKLNGVLWVAAATLLISAVAIPTESAKPIKSAPIDAAREKLNAEFKKKVLPILEENCLACHTGPDSPNKFDLSVIKSAEDVAKNPSHWAKVGQYVKSQVMPPKGADPMKPEDRRLLTDWFTSAMAPDCGVNNPGRVTIRRLNRSEYTNTIRDLLGVQTDVAKDFPSDDVGYGFDNNGDVLSVSTLHAEKFIAAAEKIARMTIIDAREAVKRFDFTKATLTEGAGPDPEGGAAMFSQSRVIQRVKLERAGEYTIAFRAYGDHAGPEFPRLVILFNGQAIQSFDLKTRAGKLADYEFPVQLPAGDHNIAFAFLNDYYDPNFPDPAFRDRNIHLRSFEVRGPHNVAGPVPASHTALLGPGPAPVKNDEAHIRPIFDRLTTRAYRRPSTKDEVDRLITVYQAMRSRGASYERAMQVCLTAVLCNPNFLFRIEAASGNLSSYEIASRLSYALWSSMPDATLTAAARNNELSNPIKLREQVGRLLTDPKSTALAEDFAAQWLQLRKLEQHEPDKGTFANYSPSLKAAFVQEAKLVFRDLVTSNRSVLDLIGSKDTFVNEELARYYRIPGIVGKEFKRAKHVDPNRGGIIGMGSFLTVSSNPTRTSPVKRGKFVLEELLGTPPPPPPPNVGVLPDDAKAIGEKSIKERLEIHRKNPACANCHQQMDAIGFSLENFDAIGNWRTMDGKFKVDSATSLPDGQKLEGPEGLRKLLTNRQDEFVRAFTEKLMIYMLGRGLTPADTCVVDQVVADAKKNGYKFRSFVEAIVLSEPFTKRAAAAP